MKIAVNMLPYTSYQGTETYTKNILNSAIRSYPNHKFIFIGHELTPQLFRFSGENVEFLTLPIKKFDRFRLPIFQQIRFYSVLRAIAPDALLCTSHSAPFFYKNKFVTIHDCSFDRFNEWPSFWAKLYIKAMYYGAKWFSKKIITISDFSKRELMDVYGISESSIKVIYEGVPKLPSPTANSREILQKFKIRNKYFLYIGVTRPRKNIQRLLKSFKIFSEKFPGYILVLAGKIDTSFFDVLSEIEKLGIRDKVIQTDFISDDEKVILYKNSEALLFPSLYEGFGLPVLEAQNFGIPVLTSKTSCLPEIGGEGGACYVDPTDENDIAEGMEKILNEQFRKEIITRGGINVRRFSWDKAAQELIREIELRENQV